MPMKTVYLLPNLLTTGNMFCGFNAIVSAVNGNFVHSAWLILVAMVFDLMDGRVARLTRTTTAFGVEYDSFSDLVSFGIAPALVTYLWCLQHSGRLGWLVAFLYMVCAALRLARFNVMVSVVPKKYFQGLPSPIAAAGVATLVIFTSYLELEFPRSLTMIGLLIALGALMISSVYFPSFKDVKVKRENAIESFAIIILVLVLIAAKPEIMLFAFVYAYIVLGFIFGSYNLLFRKKEIMAGMPSSPSEPPKPVEGQ